MSNDFFEDYESGPDPSRPRQDDDAIAIATAVKDRVDSARESCRPWIASAWDSWAWWEGRHYQKWDHELENFVESAPEYDNQIRLNLNYTRSAIEGILSKLVAHDPGWDVSPATADEEDVDAARASNDLLAHYHRDLEGRSRLTRFARAGLVTGLGVMRVHWDALGGEPVVSRDEDGNPLIGKDGQPIMVMSGTPRMTEIPATAWFSDGGYEPDMSDTRWCCEMSWLHIEDIRETWPETGQLVTPSGAEPIDPIQSLALGHRPLGSGAAMERALVYRYYEVPSTTYPRGRYVACTESVLLEELDALPGRGRLPYAVFSTYARNGVLRGQGRVEDLKPLNAQINRQESKRSELVDLHANPKVIIEENSIRKNQWTNEPGEVIQVAKNARRPEILPPPPISPQHEAIVTQYLGHMSALSGVSELAPGNSPAAASGRRLQFEDELASARLLTTSTDFELAVKRLGSLILELCQENLPPEMMIRVLGQDGRLQARRFYSSAVRSTDVSIEVGSMQLKHPSVQRETVMAAFERNLLGDRNDPAVQRMARKLMEIGGDKFLAGDRTADRDYQREENYALATGLPVEALPYEPHDIHIDELMGWMSTVEFRRLPPQNRQAAMQHLASHEAYKAMAANGQPWWVSVVPPELAAQAFPQGVPAPPVPEGAAPPMLPVDPFGVDPGDAALAQVGAMQGMAQAVAKGPADGGRGLPAGQPPGDAPPIKMGGTQLPPSGAGAWGT